MMSVHHDVIDISHLFPSISDGVVVTDIHVREHGFFLSEEHSPHVLGASFGSDDAASLLRAILVEVDGTLPPCQRTDALNDAMYRARLLLHAR